MILKTPAGYMEFRSVKNKYSDNWSVQYRFSLWPMFSFLNNGVWRVYYLGTDTPEFKNGEDALKYIRDVTVPSLIESERIYKKTMEEINRIEKQKEKNYVVYNIIE